MSRAAEIEPITIKCEVTRGRTRRVAVLSAVLQPFPQAWQILQIGARAREFWVEFMKHGWKHESYHKASAFCEPGTCVLKASLAIVIVIAVVVLAAIFTRAFETEEGPCLPRPIIIRTFTETV